MKKYIYALTITLGLFQGEAYGAAAAENPGEEIGFPYAYKLFTEPYCYLKEPGSELPRTSNTILTSLEEEKKIEERHLKQISALPNRFNYDPEKTDAQNKADFIKVLEGLPSGEKIAVFFPTGSDHFRLLNDVEGATLSYRFSEYKAAEYRKN